MSKTIKITPTTTVSQLRAKHSDYTIARMLAEKLGIKDRLPKMLVKDYPYTVARKLLAKAQKAS